MRYLNKKGISPLIATVLLIGFTVALAAVVITWGGGFVERVTLSTEERTTKAIACTSELNFEIKKVLCISPTNPGGSVTIDNKANTVINELILRFFDENGNFLSNRKTGIINGFEIKTVVPVAETSGGPTGVPAGSRKVEGLAKITLEGNEVTCSETVRTKSFTC